MTTGTNKLRVLDLFSGIGGFSLGLEKTGGFETAAFCEIDKAAQRVLKKHWPNVPIFEDVSTLTAKDLDGTIDVICGGFPCQDISLAGKGAGLAGERSGLWFQFHRLIQEIKPKWVIAENVSALRSRGLDEVLRSLAEIGYDAEWHCIPASAVGAPHQRDRIWILGYPHDNGPHGSKDGQSCASGDDRGSPWSHELGKPTGSSGTGQGDAMAYTSHERLQGGEQLRDHLTEALRGWQTAPRSAPQCCPVSGGTIYPWHTEPNVGRVADGVSGRVDRLKQLGNAVVPQIPELIGNAILRTNSL